MKLLRTKHRFGRDQVTTELFAGDVDYYRRSHDRAVTTSVVNPETGKEYHLILGTFDLGAIAALFTTDEWKALHP